MKKIIFTLAFICILTTGAFGQTDGMLNINEYSKLFHNDNGDISRRYYREASDEDYDWIAALGGSSATSVDTPLEITLLTICAGVAEIRPAEANRMLGNARQADLKLGAAVFQEILILRFLNDTAAVNRHEAVLQYITGRGNATRAEIETFYRNNIRAALIASAGDRVDLPHIDTESVYTVTVINDGRALEINRYRGANRAISIPSQIEGLPVIRIGSSAFSDNQLTNITIPNSVTSIGDWAFRNNRLTSVIIPSSVTSIGSGAFQGNQLTSVSMPARVSYRSSTFDDGVAVVWLGTLGSQIDIHHFTRSSVNNVWVANDPRQIYDPSSWYEWNRINATVNASNSIEFLQFWINNGSEQDILVVTASIIIEAKKNGFTEEKIIQTPLVPAGLILMVVPGTNRGWAIAILGRNLLFIQSQVDIVNWIRQQERSAGNLLR